MISRAEFQELVSSAYQSLYDFIRLRTHPLASLLTPDTSINHKEKGWQLHHVLLDVVEELYPGAAAPPFSKEWRRHRLMVLRYIEAMDPRAVAEQLNISRRQYYREHATALEAVADILWSRCDKSMLEAVPASSRETSNSPSEAMQLELARINLNDAYADLGEVFEGAIAILGKMVQQNAIQLDIDLPPVTPITSIGHSVLRQVILGLLGYLIEKVNGTTLQLKATTGDTSVYLAMTTNPLHLLDEADFATQFVMFSEMLQLGHGSLRMLRDETNRPVGFELELPFEYDCIVLAVDDNEDTLALYKRFLTPNGYRIITAKSAQAGLTLTREVKPDIIILDLMMPEQDGWDLLQLLSNQVDTAHIPIVICSVLKQKQLALSLGAAAFLEKPFTEQILLETLERVRDAH
ncbi:MAG TPA: response regulator [Aggregatilineaceae bacterium]|nr:response regulator [Aggregatilineaceae bacterium]